MGGMVAIKIFRILRGKSQFKLSLETLIPNYRLSLLENGKADPTPVELEKLVAALKTTPEMLTRDCVEALTGGNS